MITIHNSVAIPYSLEASYTLINDISAYSQFVPFCTAATMQTINEKTVEGTLTFAWFGIVESFTTHNTLHPPYTINMTLIKGPFKQLNGGWKFTEIEKEKTQVEFLLTFEFEFSNTWVDYFLQPIFNTLSTNAMKVFIQRAHDCYANKAH